MVARLLSAENMCPRCAAEFSRRRAYHRLLIWLGLFVGTLAAAIHSKSDQELSVIASILLLYPFLHFAVIPHELGHALAARLVGFEVVSVQIGRGTPLWSVLVGEIELTHGSVALGGHTQWGTQSIRWYRTRTIIVTLAGPAANLLCLWLAVHFASDGASRVHTLPDLYLLPAWVAANFLVFFANLVPAKDRRTGKPTDGLMVWRTVCHSMTAEARHNLMISAPLVKALHLLRRSKYERAEANARRAYESDPSFPPSKLVLGMALFYRGNRPQGEALLKSLRDSEAATAKTPEFRASLNTQIALVEILSPDASRWPIARELAEAAYREIPWDNSVTLIYGACIALTEDWRPGSEILELAVPKTRDSRDFCLLVRALASARAGRLGEAADVLATARAPRGFDVLRATIDELLGHRSADDKSTATSAAAG